MKYFTNSEYRQFYSIFRKGNFWYPKILKLTLLEKCNWRCTMCSCEKNRNALLDINEWHKIIDEAIKLGVEEINFTGGEPTLFPNFIELIDGIGKLDPESKIKLKLLTNATQINKRVAKKYLELGIKRYIISLHSHTPKIHDTIVGIPGQWKRTYQGIHNLSDLKYEIDHSVWINCVVQKSNFLELPNMINLAKLLGCEGVSFSPLDNRLMTNTNMALNENEMQTAFLNILPEVRKRAKYFDIKLFPEDVEIFGSNIEDFKYYAKGELSRGYYKDHPCYWVYYHLTIEPDGTVQPCCNKPLKNGYGNATKMPIIDIINGKKVSDFLKTAKNIPDSLSTCHGCEMKLHVNKIIHEVFSNI